MRTRHARRLLAAVTLICLAVALTPAAGADDGGDLGPTRSTEVDLAQKRYVAAGDRAYVIGAQDGSFPPMGWHIRGEMGGVWAHPIKLLDGYWFQVEGAWLPAAERFTTGPGYVRLDYPRTRGLGITRVEFAPDDLPVTLVGLRLRNPGERPRRVVLAAEVRSDIMAAYPWGWSEPENAGEFNRPDRARFRRGSGRLLFRERGKPWFAAVASKPRPRRGRTGDGFWGPVPPDQRAGYEEFGDGAGARLRWRLRIPPGEEQTLWVAVGGSHTDRRTALRATRRALSHPLDLLDDKVAQRQELLSRTQVHLPDAVLQAAFDWGKLNLADLRITATDLAVRDVDAGLAYREPVGTLPEATGIGAGFPDYPWYFGTDGAYTAHALLVSGQWDTLAEHLRTIRDASRLLNGPTGKVIHELVTDGSVYWGTNEQEGNTNETAQFATAVLLYWRWSGDHAFLEEMYDFVVDGLEYVTSELDDDADLWPEGHGMVERPGMGEEKLDVAAYTWQALEALAPMAQAMGDPSTAAWAAEQADAMEAAFADDWWMQDEGLFADSLCNSPTEEPAEDWVNYCREAGQQLQQRHWINAVPAETLMADAPHAQALLDRMESEEFTGENGLYHTGVGGGPTGAGELRVWTLPNSVMAVGEANYGRLGEQQALFYMDAIAEEIDLEMPGALPEIVPSPEYDPFVDFRDRAMFMQAWSSYGTQWPVIHHFLGIRPDVPAGRLTVVPDIPESWPGLSVANLGVGDGTVTALAWRSDRHHLTFVDAPGGSELVIGHALPATAEVEAVRLDGTDVPYEVVDTARGREVRVTAPSGSPHTLVVTSR